MRALFLTSVALTALAPAAGFAQGILPEAMYGVFALDDSCAANSRRMLVTPTDILIADPGLDIRVSYPDQRLVSGDEVALKGNFFTSVVYDGKIARTADGAVMTFNFPDLSFPLLTPILGSVFGDNIPTAILADLNLTETADGVEMTLASDDPSLGERLARSIGTWRFEAEQITRIRGEAESVYPRCYGGNTAQQQHASLVSAAQTGVYSFNGGCAAGSEAFVIAQDGWGLSIPFADPTIGFAFDADGSALIGELYRGPFALLAPDENSYIDIEVRDGASSHRLDFSGDGFSWTKTLTSGDLQEAGTYAKCAEFGSATFAEVVADIDAYLN